MKKIQAVIFDMDGLLLDSEPIQFEASHLLYRQYGYRFTLRHLKRFLGVRVIEELTTLKQEWQLQSSVNELMAKRRDIFLRLIRKKLKLVKGARGLLTFLRHIGVPIGLGTSADRWYIDEALEKFHLRHYFDAIVDSKQVRKGKPHPEVYLKVAKQLKVLPAQCLVLEDAVNGVVAAKNAGMMCFAVPSPYVANRYYKEADKIFPSLRHVTNVLKIYFKRGNIFSQTGFARG